MATTKRPAKRSAAPGQKTARPIPVKKVPVQAVAHSKTLANGQPRPKKRG